MANSYLIFSGAMLILFCLGPFLWWVLRVRKDLAANRSSSVEVVTRSLVFAGWSLFVLVCARWDVLSFWLRPIFAVFFICATAWTLHRLSQVPRARPTGIKSIISLALRSILGLLLLTAAAFAVAGYRTPTGATDLAFPLRGGLFEVGQGGASKLINYHQGHRQQAYALDISRLYWFGGRAKGPFPTMLSDYAVYETEVISPCSGIVREVLDGTVDQEPGQMNPSRPTGNLVKISCLEVVVTLAHLKPGSVRVQAGQKVQTATLLGLAGNSGNTSEPHLHVHAVTDLPGATEPDAVPITFDGRFLVRGSLALRQ
jgi:hypothetical protein